MVMVTSMMKIELCNMEIGGYYRPLLTHVGIMAALSAL